MYVLLNYISLKRISCNMSMRMASHHCECACETSYYFLVKMICYTQYMWTVSPWCAFAYEPSFFMLMLFYLPWTPVQFNHCCLFVWFQIYNYQLNNNIFVYHPSLLFQVMYFHICSSHSHTLTLKCANSSSSHLHNWTGNSAPPWLRSWTLFFKFKGQDFEPKQGTCLLQISWQQCQWMVF